jgi:guanylate kinase
MKGGIAVLPAYHHSSLLLQRKDWERCFQKANLPIIAENLFVRNAVKCARIVLLMPDSTPKTGKLVLLIGPSGVGKSVILLHLRNKYPQLHFPKSATTRPRRPGESETLYYFVNDAAFDQLLADNKILEWAYVHGGQRYGTMIDEIIPAIEAGKIVIREVDVQGFESIRQHHLFSGPGAIHQLQSIFILPESTDQLLQHITRRAPIAKEELEKRMKSMEKELMFADKCDVQIRNHEGKLQETIDAVEHAIFDDTTRA